jgi:Plasmid pRiA4b ORF-3-like protein
MPSVWRQVAIPEAFNLEQLHRTIQLCFGWLDYHLYQFELGSRRFRPAQAETDGEDSGKVGLKELHLKRGARLTYTYDWGDCWEHDCELVQVEVLGLEDPFAQLPAVLDGARAGPPEDCGGPPGYEHLLATLRGENGAEEAAAMRQWVGPHFDPDCIDLHVLDHALVLASAWRVI